MDGLSEKIFELASQDEEFAEKFGAAETPEAIVALLAEKGLDVAADDLQALAQPAAEGAVKLSEDELDAVAGGKACYCVVGGGGVKGKYDETCGCAAAGWGYFIDHTAGDRHVRCQCAVAGEGVTHD